MAKYRFTEFRKHDDRWCIIERKYWLLGWKRFAIYEHLDQTVNIIELAKECIRKIEAPVIEVKKEYMDINEPH